MCDTGFMNPELPKKLMPRLRRLFARSGLEPEEVNILRGILKALSRPRQDKQGLGTTLAGRSGKAAADRSQVSLALPRTVFAAASGTRHT